MKCRKIGIGYLSSLLLAIVITIAFLLLQAFLQYKLEPSELVISVCMIATYLASNLLAGLYMGHKVEKKQYLWGLFVGLGYFALVLIASFLVDGGRVLQVEKGIVVFFLCSCSGMLGGMIR